MQGGCANHTVEPGAIAPARQDPNPFCHERQYTHAGACLARVFLQNARMGQLNGLRVIRSKIHGFGLIALRPFAAGETLCEGDGVLWRTGEEFDDRYCLIIDGPDPKAPLFWDLADQTRWINHSCDPNTEIDAEYDPATDSVTATWIAARDIHVGEELTYDYAFSAEVAEVCDCGAPTCRGLIIDPDELHKAPAHLKKHVKQPR